MAPSPPLVIAGLDPATHVVDARRRVPEAWVPGSSPGMTHRGDAVNGRRRRCEAWVPGSSPGMTKDRVGG
jgi:hypothetical protein